MLAVLEERSTPGQLTLKTLDQLLQERFLSKDLPRVWGRSGQG